MDVILQELRGQEPQAQTARPGQFIDPTFVKELHSSGFIDRVYKTAPASVAAVERGPADARPRAREKLEEPPRRAQRTEPAMASLPSVAAKDVDYTVKAAIPSAI